MSSTAPAGSYGCRQTTSMAVDSLHPSDGTETLPPSSGAVARHARHAHPPDAAMGTATWLRHRADHCRAVFRIAEDRNRIALPRAPPPRKTGLGEERVDAERGEAARQVLPHHRGGQEAAHRRTRSLVAAGGGDRHHTQPEAVERVTT